MNIEDLYIGHFLVTADDYDDLAARLAIEGRRRWCRVGCRRSRPLMRERANG